MRGWAFVCVDACGGGGHEVGVGGLFVCGKVVGLDELYPGGVYGGELGCGVLR